MALQLGRGGGGRGGGGRSGGGRGVDSFPHVVVEYSGVWSHQS